MRTRDQSVRGLPSGGASLALWFVAPLLFALLVPGSALGQILKIDTDSLTNYRNSNVTGRCVNLDVSDHGPESTDLPQRAIATSATPPEAVFGQDKD
jgi:hypothetical protein